jgi:hypothetical protein
MNTNKVCCRIFSLSVLFFIWVAGVQAQINTDTLQGRNLYHPKNTMHTEVGGLTDTISTQSRLIVDSLAAVRYQRMMDSIEARQIFVRDSIARRQHILDSLNVLKAQLPLLLDASLKTFTENLILSYAKIEIIGDSMLSNYTSMILPITIDQPYTPWRYIINLSDKPPKILFDENTGKIISIVAAGLNCSFAYGPRSGIIKITGKGLIASTGSGKVYKQPVDSVFTDQRGRVMKVKRYMLFSTIVNNYQQGAFLYAWLSQVKQFEYTTDNQLSKYHVVNFCERTATSTVSKVCFMVTYQISREGNSYILIRKNDPPNSYSDGTFTYEFDNTATLKSVAFANFTNTENWKTFIELNEAGNVSNYIYQNKGFVNKSLMINYYLDNPKAKNKIETISCTFEDDGVSYYQINNMTGKSRVRDRLTMEWSDWK